MIAIYTNPLSTASISVYASLVYAAPTLTMIFTNCGFFYLLFTCVMGLIGLILFSVAAKKYKYRERDEGMFSQQQVEEVYERYIIQAVEEQRSIDQYSD